MTEKLSDRAEGVVYVARMRDIWSNSCGGSQLYLMLFPLFLHLTHSSQGGCWIRGLSNIRHCSSEQDVETYTHHDGRGA